MSSQSGCCCTRDKVILRYMFYDLVYIIFISLPSASDSSAAVIAGIVVGGVVVLLVILTGIVFMAYKLHTLDSGYV